MMVTFMQHFVAVSIPILEDTVVESTEMFSAVLSSTHPNVILGQDSVNITIIDNDGEVLC